MMITKKQNLVALFSFLLCAAPVFAINTTVSGGVTSTGLDSSSLKLSDGFSGSLISYVSSTGVVAPGSSPKVTGDVSEWTYTEKVGTTTTYVYAFQWTNLTTIPTYNGYGLAIGSLLKASSASIYYDNNLTTVPLTNIAFQAQPPASPPPSPYIEVFNSPTSTVNMKNGFPTLWTETYYVQTTTQMTTISAGLDSNPTVLHPISYSPPPSTTPEPTSLLLLGGTFLGLAGIRGWRRWRKTDLAS